MSRLLEVLDLSVHFQVPGGWRARTLRAVDGVSFYLEAGRTLGIVGESGCGKSTLARAIAGLVPATGGSIRIAGQPLATRLPRALRRKMQIIFQDPHDALDPRMTAGEIIAEPLRALMPELGRKARRRRVEEMLERVGLRASQINRYPHEFSGGQCQRIGIARALAAGPELLICDEPVSALDVSIQAQIVNLLMELQQTLGLALLFIAHDLAVVRQISHEVMVMYLGQIVEQAPREQLFGAPEHPYTHALMEAVPVPDPEVARSRPAPPLRGEPPSPIDPPGGCRFHGRCPRAVSRCAIEPPPLANRSPDHRVACHLPGLPGNVQ